MTETYTIIATLKDDMASIDLIDAMQGSYDAGAAGRFETKRIPSGYAIAFQREVAEDAPLIEEALGADTNPDEIARLAIVQLAAEFGGISLDSDKQHRITDFEAILDRLQAAIKATGWLPFPDALAGEVCAIRERGAEARDS